ncbi:MFS transporter [Limobrevibacterium gyesilva]|uniref:MFS transporter n=1 Tax=Limobrevibacterium gyesilva TaxID=2991712 RepID=A0AA41YRK7_9PROT|nr:MFS transporter [Limobrevibacterium gyesilva]MCW3477028.1 MFS transporter [Limobrevibacterium gyesilva]
MQKAVAEIDTPADAIATHARVLPAATGTVFPVLIALSFCHMLNDMMQSMISALYPLLKAEFMLDFTQVGLITLTFQLTASLLQPAVGLMTDRKPMPFSLAVGMGFTLVGLLLLAVAATYPALLFAAGMVGIGSSVFHPESSRVARAASGGRYGLAQSLFQVGGNAGAAIGPLLAAVVVLTRGQTAVAWFSLAALLGMLILVRVGTWYRAHMVRPATKARAVAAGGAVLTRGRVAFAIFILAALTFSKNVYTASLSSYFTFYLIDRFQVSVHDAQVHLFVFMSAVAAGTLLGGPVTDRIGRKATIWISILGVLPFTLALPYANLFFTDVLTIIIGLLMASAFPAILVYAQELVPGRVGMIAGIFFGFAFGLGGLGAAVMGRIADSTSIEFVYRIAAFLPMIGLLTALLPNLAPVRVGRKPA